MNKIYLDFETRSVIDLKTHGTARYAEDSSTEILCVGFKTEEDSDVWLIPNGFNDYGSQLQGCAEDPKWSFTAHNAFFEQQIWKNIMVKRYGYPEIPIERWRCTMAKCLAYGLPGSLDRAAKTLKLPISKDLEGRESMLKLSTPRRGGEAFGFWKPEQKPEEFEKLYNYCKQDVEVMRLIDQTLPDLSEKEQKIWFIDQRINNEGIQVDTATIRSAIAINTGYDKAQQQIFCGITNGIPNTARQRGKLLEWLKKNNVVLKDTQKHTIASFLEKEDVDAAVRKVLTICSASGKTSIAKYKKMLWQADLHGNVKGILQYHGAHTGRWAGRGIQIQNFPRPVVDPNVVLEAIENGCTEQLYSSVPNALSSMLRRCIIAPTGYMFLGADFSQIEARVLAWLAGQQNVLDAFKEGRDLYCEEASKIYGYHVDKENKVERNVGKVAVLALGFGGGIGAFAKMSAGYGVDLSLVYNSLWETSSESERSNARYAYERFTGNTKENSIFKNVGLTADLIKQRWRNGNQHIANYWTRVEDSARLAIKHNSVRSESIFSTQTFGNRLFLRCRLPSGRSIYYPNPRIESGSITYSSQRYGQKKTYGGELVENIVQAVARDIMTEAMYRLESQFPVAFTVHDELISIVKKQNLVGDEFSKIILKTPKWAEGLPIAAEFWQGERYGK